MKRVLPILQLCLLFTSSLHSFTNPFYSNSGKTDQSSEKLHDVVQFVDGSKDTLHVNGYALNMLGAMVLDEAEKRDPVYVFSEDALLFCKKAVENQKDFTVEELAKVVPELTKYFKDIQAATKAPRPDAPGNTDGAPVGTLIDCDLTEVLQLLNRLIRIVNQCCSILQVDFQFTWTILADIKSTITNDFNGTFTFLDEINTTLTTCCATIQNDFIGVFTSIATIDMDFAGVFTTLTEINETLTTCCANIQIDFNGVFTLIAAIDLDFSGVFTTLTEINDTLTTCCTEIQTNFDGTFTVLNALKSGECSPTPISAPGIISSPGSYCLSDDIAGTIEIASSNVTLDLNHHTISAPGLAALIINGVGNISVANGRITGSAIGIQLLNSASDVLLENMLIADSSDTGIQVSLSSNSIIMSDILIDTVTNFGVNYIGSNNNCNCTRVVVRRLAGAYGFGTDIGFVNDSLFVGCSVVDSFIAVSTCNCFFVQGNNNLFTDCSVQGVALNNAGTLSGFNVTNNSLMNNCTVEGLEGSGASSVFGFSTTNASDVIFQSCSVTNVLSPSIAEGFAFRGVNSSGIAVCTDCIATGCSGVSETAGFYSNSGKISLTNCQAYLITGGDGFFMFGDEGTILLNCTASGNGNDGFNTGASEVVVGNCVATQNVSFGFNTTSGGPLFYSCFATGNPGGNYAAAIPNAAANTSTIARGNTFL